MANSSLGVKGQLPVPIRAASRTEFRLWCPCNLPYVLFAFPPMWVHWRTEQWIYDEDLRRFWEDVQITNLGDFQARFGRFFWCVKNLLSTTRPSEQIFNHLRRTTKQRYCKTAKPVRSRCCGVQTQAVASTYFSWSDKIHESIRGRSFSKGRFVRNAYDFRVVKATTKLQTLKINQTSRIWVSFFILSFFCIRLLCES